MNEIKPLLDALASQANPGGGWGYSLKQPAHLEPTCLALLALSLQPDSYREVIEQGLHVIDDAVCSDGFYRLAQGRVEAVWPTALVLFVRTALGEAPATTRKVAQSLLGLRGRIPDDPHAADQMDIDTTIIGWPWASNTFSWAEPTAWACLALQKAGYAAHPRVQEGLQLLLDRSLDEGGINYGNRRVFDRLTAPLTEPTALMVLALQNQPNQPRVRAALNYLRNQAENIADLEQLCWAKLALSLFPFDPDIASGLATLDKKILEAHKRRGASPWLSPAPLKESFTALALASERNHWFRLKPNSLQEPLPNGNGSIDVFENRPLSDRLRGAFRGFLLEGANRLRPLHTQTSVHIAKAADYSGNLSDILKRQYEEFRSQVPLKGKRVVLKPNLVEYHRDKVINTHPHMIAGVIELCQREGAAEVIVAEGPGHCRNVEYLVSASGLGDVLGHYRVPFMDLNHDEPIKTLNLGRLTGLEHLYLARTIATAEVVISLPKLKTHHWAGATLSLKNLFGTMPGICYGWPKNELHWRGIDNSIIDIALTRTPHLAIVDGIVAMEGDGPLNGTPKALGAIIMGSDLLAVDATCCRLMRLDPELVGYLLLGQRKKLGLLRQPQIRQIGETIASLAQPFETLPHFHNLYSGRSA